ncbi:TAT-binding protein-like protein 7, AAA ATPase [Marasmius tenuissimus]|uniref:TAT-binding protein-like protein 7, AAA ATPase n=1 Tax=Marasmius tenuissimus TaxID=585030 RepID=A0ABR2ZQG4_9AGAR
MAAGHDAPLRRSTRRASAASIGASGSEYQDGSDKSMQGEETQPVEEDEVEEEEKPLFKTRSGRTVMQASYVESSEADDDLGGLGEEEAPVGGGRTRSRPAPRASADDGDDEEEEDFPARRRLRNRRSSFIASDDDAPAQNGGYGSRLRKRTTRNGNPSTPSRMENPKVTQAKARALRAQRRHKPEEDVYMPHQHTSPGSVDADGSFDEDAQGDTDVDDLEITMNDTRPEPEEEEEEPENGKKYSLRQRQRINYTIPPPLEDIPTAPPKSKPLGGRRPGGRKGLGFSLNGAELGRLMGLDDSDSDAPTRTPRKPFGGMGALGGGLAGGGGGLLAGDLAAAGTPSNLGRVGDSTLADADPLGVNVNVTFDEVGGLDDHINSLKEMTVLPLLYPEVFQQFKVTPPRGVLFHGPPGTGKTLLARALAASCRSNGKQISFFMRKGADALSKWVGEAERQLRLLFEEARNSQPSIIFFDEIDGLAPVRSSKQDQIHASIVSTLLALMDGMDGRGQVVVIGATNRPDAIDPALRRPGRFDREFYFPLPGLEAREKILGIMTKGWKDWGDEEQESKDRLNGLAKLTKGYGGADLRALCTEAALNAVQRKYPQIYKSNDRLLLQPDSVKVGLRDFMISIKKIVPSSARSSSSAAMPLPPQFVPLLSETLENAKKVIGRVIPSEKKLTALEEAEFEDYEGEAGALEREMTLQSMEKLRIYRPRIVLHGAVGMGQAYVGAAVLHHLEGYHVQSLELGSLLGDSTRTTEAAIVQLFVEAKRHQPSVIYIPSLVGWCAAVSETARSTVRAMLDTLAPTDPILLLAIVDGRYHDLPRDVRSWFGLTKDNRVEIPIPTESQRVEFFQPLVEDVRRPPNLFADGMPRKKRILEELPIAPPPEPRKPTAAELAVQEENDHRTIAILKYRLTPILNELKRKFRRFTKRAREEYSFAVFEGDEPPAPPVPVVNTQANGVIDITSVDAQPDQPLANGIVNEQVVVAPPPPPVPQGPKCHDMDLERMNFELFRGRYLTIDDFMNDLRKICMNAALYEAGDPDRHLRAQAMLNSAEVSIQEFDAIFRLECERMAGRERQRRAERRKAREEEKAKAKAANGNGNGSGSDTGAPGARRSGRNTGMAPEYALTDPSKLERRLKRQREGFAADSLASDEENGESRDPKRSKMHIDTEDDRDPLELVSPPRQPTVRFAAPAIQPMQPLVPPGGLPMGMMQPGPSSMHSQQSAHPLDPSYSMYPQGPSQYMPSNQHMHSQHPVPQHSMQSHPSMQPHHSMHSHHLMPPHDSMQFNQQPMQPHSMHHGQPMHHNAQPMQGMYMNQANHHQFDSSIRHSHSPHPMSPAPGMSPTNGYQEMQHHPGPWHNNNGGQPSQYPNYHQPQQHHNDMSIDPPHSQLQTDLLTSQRNSGFDPALLNPLPDVTSMPSKSPVEAATNPPVVNDDPFLSMPVPQEPIRKSKSPQPQPEQPTKQSKSPEPPREPSPMPIVARTPTPLPEFHVDESLLAQLQSSLRSHTASLTIEQLEQLRATCLSCVWRNRREWDRGSMIRELQDLVNDFVAEVAADSVTSDEEIR